MNANELADWIENGAPFGKYETAKQAVVMLRQQQAEIEALKQIIDANNLNQNIGQFVKPTNEPVAWAYIKDGNFFDAVHPDEHEKYEGMYTTPLYTHPVKELTDEEILEFRDEVPYSYSKDLIDFARAILRKAQEK